MGDKNKNIKPLQQEKISKIGSYLRQIRLEKNISLEAIAQKTLIPLRLLKAIESGDVEELPELFYTRALIGKFAKELGVREIKDFQIKQFHLYLLYILVIITSVKGITTRVERPIIINKIQVAKQIPLESPVTINSPSPEPSTTLISQSEAPQSAVVNITLKDRCWLKVIVDGKVEFEGTLPKGTNRTWTGKEQVTIRAGNAGGVFITFNDGQEKLLGKPGQVEEVTYTVN